MNKESKMEKIFRLYNKVRLGDITLNKKIKFVADYIFDLTGEKPSVVGSIGMGINIFGSDIDLAIGVTQQQKEEIKKKLDKTMEFRGERIATPTSTRSLYCMNHEGTHVDLMILNKEDYRNLLNGVIWARIDMSETEKACHVYNKIYLGIVDENKLEDYKMAIYKRYNPKFSWIPDYVIRENLANKIKEEGKDLPKWLTEENQVRESKQRQEINKSGSKQEIHIDNSWKEKSMEILSAQSYKETRNLFSRSFSL